MEKANEDVIDKPNKDIESEAIEKFKNIIFNNWDTIKETIHSIKKMKQKKLIYRKIITHFFNKTLSTYNIEKNSRKINFKKKNKTFKKLFSSRMKL